MSELAPFRSGHNEATPQNHMDLDFRKSSYSDRNNCVEVAFRKSSYSNQAQNCVEVADVPGASLIRDTQNRHLGHVEYPADAWAAFLAVATFRKSSYSATANECVEVADLPGKHLVRDTQNRQLGHLAFPSAEWRALISTTRREK
ncbi:DUF397 domain-containing protein [Nocardiopsis sp. NPDC006198]|uniref:DUF397 domain-containing protein n=1 Tax=Nocardiopsis sp. NPDC006198 TaxID=3154472 RepID=UPI0033A9F870